MYIHNKIIQFYPDYFITKNSASHRYTFIWVWASRGTVSSNKIFIVAQNTILNINAFGYWAYCDKIL